MLEPKQIESIVSWSMRAIVAGAIAVSVWTGNRLVSNLDSQSTKLEEVKTTVLQGSGDLKILQNQIESGRRSRDSQFLDLKNTLQDHEGRIRVLERPTLTRPN